MGEESCWFCQPVATFGYHGYCVPWACDRGSSIFFFFSFFSSLRNSSIVLISLKAWIGQIPSFLLELWPSFEMFYKNLDRRGKQTSNDQMLLIMINAASSILILSNKDTISGEFEIWPNQNIYIEVVLQQFPKKPIFDIVSSPEPSVSIGFSSDLIIITKKHRNSEECGISPISNYCWNCILEANVWSCELTNILTHDNFPKEGGDIFRVTRK